MGPPKKVEGLDPDKVQAAHTTRSTAKADQPDQASRVHHNPLVVAK